MISDAHAITKFTLTSTYFYVNPHICDMRISALYTSRGENGKNHTHVPTYMLSSHKHYEGPYVLSRTFHILLVDSCKIFGEPNMKEWQGNMAELPIKDLQQL